MVLLATILALAGALGLAKDALAAPQPDPVLQISFEPSFKTVSLEHAAPGQILEYTIHIVTDFPGPVPGQLTDEVPPVLDFVPGSEWLMGDGVVWFEDGVIHWEGLVPPMDEVIVGFSATVSRLIPAGQPITKQAHILDVMTGLDGWRGVTTIAETDFGGYDNAGKTAVDSGAGEGGTCAPWECTWAGPIPTTSG